MQNNLTLPNPIKPPARRGLPRKSPSKGLVLTLLLALVGVGAFPSAAATYNIPVTEQWTLIGINVDTTAAGTLDNMLSSNLPDGSTMLRWNSDFALWNDAETYFPPFGWIDSSFNPSASLALGQGAVVSSPLPLTYNVTVTGATPPIVPVAVTIDPGRYYLLASQNLNNPGFYADIVGHNNPPAPCTQLFKYVPGPGHSPAFPFVAPSFIIYTYTGGQWMEDTGNGPATPNAPQIATGEGVWIAGPPVITIATQPVSLNADACSPATFTVLASSGLVPLSYQWEKSTDGGATWVPIASAIYASHTLYPVTAADNGLYRVVIDNGCSVVTSTAATLTFAPSAIIQGVKFNDANGDGQQAGNSDYSIPNWTICLDTVPSSTPRYTTTDATGGYSFCVPAGTYTVSEVQQANWAQTAPAIGTHPVTVTAGQIVSNMDFGNQTTASITDMAVDITARYPYPLRSPCCGQEMTLVIDYRNLGTVAINNPKVELVLSANLTCLDYQTSPTSAVLPCPNNGKWNFPGAFVPGASGTLYVRVKVDNCPSGQTPVVVATANIPLPSDNVLGNNTDSHSENATCSMDPNDKTVTPKGCGPLGLISQDQDTLTYLIRFQNLGTAPAFLVVIRDMLDPNLDLTSIEQLGSSHPATFHLNGREMVWTFWDIVLPPLSTDELGSQGHVKFRVKLNPNPAVGTRIENTAAIYFDLNDPVITATTLNTITADPLPVASFTRSAQSGSGGHVFDFTYTGGTAGATFHWNFGPGSLPETSTDQDPVGVRFPIDGGRLVILHVDLAGCGAEPAIQTLRIGRPRLSLLREATQLYISWPGDGFGLEETANTVPPMQWSPNLTPAISVGGENVVILPVDNLTRFFQLRAK